MGIGQVCARGSIPVLNQNVNAPEFPQPYSLRGEHCTYLSETVFSASGCRSCSCWSLCKRFRTKKLILVVCHLVLPSTLQITKRPENMFFWTGLWLQKHYTFSLSEGLCLLVSEMLAGISWGKLLALTLERKKALPWFKYQHLQLHCHRKRKTRLVQHQSSPWMVKALEQDGSWVKTENSFILT